MHARQADVCGEPCVAIGSLERDLLEDARDVLPLLLGGIEPLEEERGLLAIGGELARFFEALDDHLTRRFDLFVAALEPVAKRRLRRGVEDARLRLGIALHALCGLHQLRKELGPARLLVADDLDFGVVGAEASEALERGERALGVVEDLGEVARELRLERDLSRRARRKERLELEHLGDRFVLSTRRMLTPRCLEQVEERIAAQGTGVGVGRSVLQLIPRPAVVGVVLQFAEGPTNRLLAHRRSGKCQLAGPKGVRV